MYTTFMYLDDDGSSEHILYYVLTHFVHIIHTVGEKVHGMCKKGEFGWLVLGFYAVKNIMIYTKVNY